jgi:hypothetical protein
MFLLCSIFVLNWNKGAFVMSYQHHLPGVFTSEQGALKIEAPVPATPKQIEFATTIARNAKLDVPTTLFTTRHGLSQWIDRHKPTPPTGKFSQYPSSKQVQFAERIARLKRSQVPHECFRDKTMMSRWIDGNKPR